MHIWIAKPWSVSMCWCVTLQCKCMDFTLVTLLHTVNIYLHNGWWIIHGGAEMIEDNLKLIFEQQVNDLMQKGHIVDA